jgi:DNA-binding transcriptional MerR regulator
MSPTGSDLRIGQLSRLCGLSPDTLRHYERLGLLSSERTPGRFREYGPDAERRVRIIQAALAIGFSLAEISTIFTERAAGRKPCRRTRELAGEKLIELDQRIDELSKLRKRLERVIARWDERLRGTVVGERAGLLDSLADDDPAPRRSSRRNLHSKTRRGSR